MMYLSCTAYGEFPWAELCVCVRCVLTCGPGSGAAACRPPAPQQAGSPFQHGRLLFSQLGLTSWSRRPHIHLLSKSDRLLRELRNVDSQVSRQQSRTLGRAGVGSMARMKK